MLPDSLGLLFIYLATDKLSFCVTIVKRSHNPPKESYAVSASLVSLRNNPSAVFLVLKTIDLLYCNLLQKITEKTSLITESDFSNVASAFLLKSLSLMDTLLRIRKEFRNSFLKELSEIIFSK